MQVGRPVVKIFHLLHNYEVLDLIPGSGTNEIQKLQKSPAQLDVIPVKHKNGSPL